MAIEQRKRTSMSFAEVLDEFHVRTSCPAITGWWVRRFFSPTTGFSSRLPSGKRLHSYGKSPFSWVNSTISMAIFNSYVSLPEGSGLFVRQISWNLPRSIELVLSNIVGIITIHSKNPYSPTSCQTFCFGKEPNHPSVGPTQNRLIYTGRSWCTTSSSPAEAFTNLSCWLFAMQVSASTRATGWPGWPLAGEFSSWQGMHDKGKVMVMS